MPFLPVNILCRVAWLLALLIALNSLGWAAHVDVAASGADGHAHAEVTAFDPTDSPAQADTVQHNDHCGHVCAHLIALDAACGLGLVGPDAAPPATTNRDYASIVHLPPIDPPIA